jgi:glycosyltransferase involved in cell wall biosynthesis
MRIAYITYEYPSDIDKGGISTYTLYMASIMQNRGHDVEVFCGSFDRDYTNYFEGILTHRVFCNNPHDFRENILEPFKKVQSDRPFDIIESPEVNANGYLILEYFPQIPFVTRMHTANAIIIKYQQIFTPFIKKARFVIGSLRRGRVDLGYWRKTAYEKERDIEFLITSKAYSISSPSLALKNWAIKYWKIPENRIAVIPNPIKCSPELLKISTENDSRTILYMGRLDLIKGVINLTKALKHVLEKFPEWKVVFAGADGLSHKRTKTVREFILQELKHSRKQVFFKESYTLEMLPSILKDASICVFPSYFESFSYTCAESMVAGKAIIGSINGGMAELLENGRCGMLINPHNYGNIAKAIIWLITNRQDREKFGLLARQRIIEQYSIDKIGTMMEGYYIGVINKAK